MDHSEKNATPGGPVRNQFERWPMVAIKQRVGRRTLSRRQDACVEEQKVGSGEGWQHFGKSRNCLVIVMDADGILLHAI